MEQKTEAAAAEAAAEATKSPRQPLGAAKPVSVILSVILALTLLCSCTLGILRATLSSEGISRIVSAVLGSGLLASAPREYELAAVSTPDTSADIAGTVAGLKTQDIVDKAYELGLDELLEDYGVTRDNMGELIDRSTFREFAKENAGDIVAGYLEKGSIAEAVDPELLVDFVRENEDTIYEVTGHRVTEEQYDALRSRVPDVLGRVDSTATAGIKDGLGFDLSAVRSTVAKITSPGWYIAAICASAALAVVILALHRFLFGRSLTYIAVPSLVVGILFFAAAAVIFAAGGSVLGGALAPILSTVNVSVMIRAAVLTAAGIVLFAVHFPLKKRGI